MIPRLSSQSLELKAREHQLTQSLLTGLSQCTHGIGSACRRRSYEPLPLSQGCPRKRKHENRTRGSPCAGLS